VPGSRDRACQAHTYPAIAEQEEGLGGGEPFRGEAAAPNQGVQPTASSVRSCLASASRHA